MTFLDMLRAAERQNGSMLCVGLDPEPTKFPAAYKGDANKIYDFCARIVDATADLVSSFKPQIAYFAAHRAEGQLERLMEHMRRVAPHVPIILDAKRGDIGSTAEQYAKEAFERYGADAVTVNPYLGTDSLSPFLTTPEKGTIILCRTSNAGSSEFQSLEVDGEPVYLRVARTAAAKWRSIGECALVVGATYPDELARVRTIVGDMPILVPGIGAQGGDINAVIRAGTTNPTSAAASQATSPTKPRRGLIINSSRAILYASEGADFATAARDAALATRTAINAAS